MCNYHANYSKCRRNYSDCEANYSEHYADYSSCQASYLNSVQFIPILIFWLTLSTLSDYSHSGLTDLADGCCKENLEQEFIHNPTQKWMIHLQRKNKSKK